MGTAHRPTTRRTTRTTRAALALGSALLAAGALGACSTSGGTASTGAQAPVTTTVTSTEPPAATTTTSADAGAGATTTTSAGAGSSGTTTTTSAAGGTTTSTASSTSTCKPAQMRLRVEAAEGGGSAGHVAVQLLATNIGSTECTTQGFPGVSLVAGGTGQQLGAAADRTSGQATPLMRLEPGKTAVATIQVAQAANFPSCGETTASGFRVYLPGVTAAAYVPYSLPACSNPSVHQLQVQPFNA